MTFKLPDPSPIQGDAPLVQIADALAGGEKPQAEPSALDVARDGLPTGADPLEPVDTDTGEPVQIAGIGSALKGIVSSIGKKVGQQVAAPPPVHPVPPAAAAPASVIQKPKTLPEIKQGVIERAAKLPPEGAAAQQAQDITARAASPIPQVVEPGRTDWRNFRSDKLQTSDDIKALIDDVAMQNDGFTDARRGVVSWQQTADEAQQYNLEGTGGRYFRYRRNACRSAGLADDAAWRAVGAAGRVLPGQDRIHGQEHHPGNRYPRREGHEDGGPFAPNIAVLPGTYAWTSIANAGSGRTDAFGREQSLMQAIISSVGIKVGSYPKDVLQLNAQREAQANMMEIDRNITALTPLFTLVCRVLAKPDCEIFRPA